MSYRAANRVLEPEWHNAPVDSFGDLGAILLIVGLAPGRSGANRTGRPFTGDWAGDLLYDTLLQFGFARGSYARHSDDGLRLDRCMITNAVRCAPPANKPEPSEIASCRTFLGETIGRLEQLKAILALGRVAHDSTVRALGCKPSRAPFTHGKRCLIEDPKGRQVTLFDSYHCSRYNTNTGVLTPEMFRQVFSRVREYVDA